MGWNDSDPNHDPWRGKNQPPDLDEALKRLYTTLKRALGSSRSQGPSTTSTSGPRPSSNSERHMKSLMGLFIGVIFLLWVISGIFIVDPAEQAAVLRLGRYVETVGPGPHWIPRFIESKVIANVDRVLDYSYSAQMLTKDENLVAVALVVQYRIGDLQAYLFNVSDPEESLRQATSSALRQVVGSTSLDQIITEGREAWGSRVQETLNDILASYQTGIKIVNVSPQPARAPENVQDAFDDAIKAQEDEKRFKEQARAYEASVVPIAEGNAKRILAESAAYEEQVVLRAEGDVAEFLSLLPEYLKSPQVMRERMYLEAMQQVLINNQKVMISAKTTPMMYLPMDTWMKSEKTTMKVVDEDHTQVKALTAEQPMLDGRETVRRLEPLLGRAEE